ncbi:hypothetical protein GGX14DRAFT_658872 [Mycena pura]|uniref:Xylanolytic transcriptional activator regulatory domain-containing protein n=1 Tax=Mycena pura TaxID=153505 RepID=A0AAD6V9T4_9AGAR|nr:hypothetical protein GGX14DRAFT_658872 [Mycena pura]
MASDPLSGRDRECSWGRESTARKPKTDAHFEALRKRADALQVYVDLLEGMLAKCACQDVSSHIQFRPQQPEERNHGEESETDFDESEEEITKELTVPTQRLKAIVPPSSETPPTPDAPAVDNPHASYVLLVDGVDEAHAHPDIDWSRHLPATVGLDRKEHDKILDISFKFWVGWGLRAVPSLFLKDMYRALRVPRSQQPPKTLSYSPVLHNAMLAICAIFSSDPHIRARKTRECFADAARACLKAECRKPQISLVHALAFLGTFYADAGERILADLYVGEYRLRMSSRISMTLGLEVDCTPWVKSGFITYEEKQARHWTHWAICYRDVCWALVVGRHFCGPPMDGHAIAMPFVDSAADQLPWFYAPANIPPQPNLITLVFYETTALAMIARKIIDIVCSNELDRARHDTLKVDQLVTKIDLDLYNWKSRLPPELDITPANKAKSTPYRLMLHCDYWTHFIYLHRPFFSRKTQSIQISDREIDHVKLCKRAAENILEIAHTWSSLYNLRHSPPLLFQTIFSAGTIFLLLALQATANVRIAHGALHTALAKVNQCIRYLHEMSDTWESAAHIRNTLRAILRDKLRPIITRRLAEKGVALPADTAAALAGMHQESTPDAAGTLPHGYGIAPTSAPNPTTSDVAQHMAAPVLGDPSFSGENSMPDLDIEGFLPNFDFGAPEHWF